MAARQKRDNRHTNRFVGAAHRTGHRVEEVDGDPARIARVGLLGRQLHAAARVGDRGGTAERRLG